MGTSARYLNELNKLTAQAQRLGHVTIEKCLYNLLLKQSAPLREGQDSGRAVHCEGVNNEYSIPD